MTVYFVKFCRLKVYLTNRLPDIHLSFHCPLCCMYDLIAFTQEHLQVRVLAGVEDDLSQASIIYDRTLFWPVSVFLSYYHFFSVHCGHIILCY